MQLFFFLDEETLLLEFHRPIVFVTVHLMMPNQVGISDYLINYAVSIL